ncbi:class I SAM-dependent methyltransferase [Phenylobacterium sp. LH3H17]|uniref:class I SAM-dependent methyltransferase n=1 Tax=Phenylobacterium sp. LH3H17 TaxID=2903901 RepID=UPI0020C9F77E|nr:class I SAM-dependent methyltransferase [Phenylobacterium sp. LH3H17]UTP39084.1 class I SAM-dependent methyltransferase [Phenylobacterium sp. LH3H17]
MPITEPISATPIASWPNAPVPNRYGAMCTEIYDLDKPPGSLPDVPFYLDRLVGTQGPILEAAVGTGRLLVPLLEAGLEVKGFDQSPDMLESCRRHCAARGLPADLRQARFQDFAYDHAFAAILVPVGTFTLIDDFAEGLAVLKRFHDHLAPGGRLLIDLLPMGYLTNERPDVRTWTAANGDMLRIEGRAVEIDLVRQRRVTHDRYERWRNGRLVESELEVMAFRIWGLAEFQLALAAAGFTDISVGADHQAGRRPGRSSRILNFEARRPAA